MSTSPSDRAGTMSVLVVEDELRLRDMLLSAIPDMGFAAQGVGSGEEALRHLEQCPADLIILDLNLPGMGGLDFFAKLRGHWPDIQVIILTGYGDLDAARQAIHLDVADFLTKPASLGDIEQALERARRRGQPPSVEPDSREPEPTVPPPAVAEPTELQEIERRHILAALERHHGNRAATAEELGISVRKLYYKLAEYQQRGIG